MVEASRSISASQSNSHWRWRLLLWAMIIAFLGFVLLRLLFRDEITPNAGYFSQMTATFLRNPARLYIDFWDHKPPMLYFWMSPIVALFGQTSLAMRISTLSVDLALIGATTWLVYQLTKQRKLAIGAGLAAALLLASVFVYFLRTEQLMAACSAIAVGIVLRWPLRRGAGFAAGIVLSLAFWTKQPAIVELPGLLAIAWVATQSHRFSRCIEILVGVGTGIIAVFGLFALLGNVQQLWEYAFAVNFSYAFTGGQENAVGTWLESTYLFKGTLIAYAPLLISTPLSIVALWRQVPQKRSLTLALALWWLSALAAANANQSQTPGYNIQMIPSSIALIALALSQVRWQVRQQPLLAALAVYTIGVAIHFEQRFSVFFTPDYTLIERIQHELAPDECLWYWGGYADVVFLAHRPSCVASLNEGPIMIERTFPTARYRQDYIEQLFRNRPTLHLYGSNWYYFPMLETIVFRYLGETIYSNPAQRLMQMNMASWHEERVQFGDAFQLWGYDLFDGQICIGEALNIATTFRVQRPLDRSYQMFIQLRNADGYKAASYDGRVHAQRPTQTWTQVGEFIAGDRLSLPIAANAPAGDYGLYIGFYDANTLEAFPISAPSASNEWEMARLSLASCTSHKSQ